MGLWNKIKLSHYKRRARGIIRRRNNWFNGYDCGAELADHISGGALKRFNNRLEETMDKIRELDTTAPPKKAESNNE